MKVAFVLPLALLATPVLAQTAPGWTAGEVPTAAQWNAEWASKADVASPVFTGTSLFGSDWLSGQTAAGLAWPVPAARSAVLSGSGRIGLTAASRASDLSSSYGSLETTIALAAFAVNDDPYVTSARHVTVYGGYDEAETLAGAYGLSFGREIDAANLSPLVPPIPTPAAPLSDGIPTLASGTTAALWLASGGGHSGANDASFAIGIKDNGARFLTGIVIGNAALTSYSGYSYAMRLPEGSLLAWHDSSDAAGPNIGSTVATGANAMSMQFQDGGTVFLNPGAATIGFSVQSQIGAVNGIAVQPVVSGASPQILAEGADANIGINLVPKGTGAVYTPAGFSAASLYASGNASIGGTLYAGGGLIGTPVSGSTGSFTTLSASLHGRFASGTTPSVGASACGSTIQGSVAGTDQAFTLTVGTASVTSCTVTFGTAYTVAPVCVFAPANATAAATGTTLAYVSATGTTSFVLAGSALAGAKYNVHCM